VCRQIDGKVSGEGKGQRKEINRVKVMMMTAGWEAGHLCLLFILFILFIYFYLSVYSP
jgi:hypothetical protein